MPLDEVVPTDKPVKLVVHYCDCEKLQEYLDKYGLAIKFIVPHFKVGTCKNPEYMLVIDEA